MEKEDPLKFTYIQALLEKINRNEELLCRTGGGSQARSKLEKRH
jgi:hypothetical protein